MLKFIVLGALGVVVAGMVWVRLAPSDAAVWNVEIPNQPVGQYDEAGGVVIMREVADPVATLAALDVIALNTPRTVRLAGSVEDGQITYITRSRVFGFPDYTTIAVGDDILKIHARLRFGGADMGVNKARVLGWLAQLDAGTATESPTQ